MANGTRSKKNAAVVKLDTEFVGLQNIKSDAAVQAIRANLEREEITPFDLIRLTVPPGGITSWQVPDDESESGYKSVDSVEGVILDYRLVRAYWESGFDEGGGGMPPDCHSDNGTHGVGTIGGDPPGSLCSECALNQFGSAGEGRKKACKEMRLLFVLPKSSIMPIVISLPPASIKGFRKYLMRLSSSDVPTVYNRVVTKFRLRREEKPMPHGVVVLTVARRLTDEEIHAMERYAETFALLWREVSVETIES